MSKIKSSLLSIVSFATGMRKLMVFFAVTGIALLLLYLGKVQGTDTLLVIKDIGIAYIGANILAKCISIGKSWAKKK